MNDRTTVAIPLGEMRGKLKARNTPKGRQVDPLARDDVAALLEGSEIRRDLLIEYLHLIQDKFGHLSDAHLAALAEAMKIAEVEATAEKLSVSAAQRGASDHFVSELSGIVIEALEELLNKGGNVWCAGESGKQLLVLAAKICGRPDLADKIDNLESEGSLRTLDKAVYDVRDPLIEFLLKEKTGQDRFIVGSAATRAMARQCGFHTYFGAKEIAILAAKEMERRQRFDYEIKQGAKISSTVRKEEDARRKALPDLAEETQKIVSHTVWNVSVPASAWRQGLNRAFILRLASIGYFTSEYVRTSMDDFIGFIHEFVNKSLTDDT
ncbi:MAG: hypothetical protein ABL932_26125, partial [Terricaulis sp.]